MIKNNEKTPLVVIRCTIYNHEPYLRDCLEGFVMQQTNFPFVAIVHDDASTDGSAAIIREYEEKYPEIIKPIYETENQYSKNDGSLTRIMNEAIGATGAKYVAMCEGDDYWIDPLKLQKQVDFLERHSEYVMCFHNVEVLSNVEEEKKLFEHLETRSYIDVELMNKWTLPTCSVLYRTKILNSKFNAKKIVLGDIFMFLRLAQAGKLYCINEKMAIYRRISNGVSTLNKNIQVELSMYKKIAKQYFYMSKYFRTNLSVSYICLQWCCKFCNYLIYNKLSKKSDRLYLITMRYLADRRTSAKDYFSLIYTYVVK